MVVDEVYCKGCGLCVTACPLHIVELDVSKITSKGYHLSHCIAQDKCTGCASCALICPDVAITVVR